MLLLVPVLSWPRMKGGCVVLSLYESCQLLCVVGLLITVGCLVSCGNQVVVLVPVVIRFMLGFV